MVSRRVIAAALVVCGAAIVMGRQANAVEQSAGAPAASIVKIVGNLQKLALRSDGTVLGWGLWWTGQLGPVAPIIESAAPGPRLPGTNRPFRVAFPGKAVDVAANESASYALLEDGTVWALGDGRQGELGTGPNPNLPLLATSTQSMQYRGAERPVRVNLQGVAAIDAASRRAVALMRDGTVREWPRKRDANSDPQFVPLVVPRLSNITQVSMGGGHTLALTASGHVWAWGDNGYGAVGIEKREYINDPVEVPGLTDVKAIAAANGVSLVVKNDGTVLVWGSNGQGQFGNGTRASHPSVDTTSVPQPVAGISNVAAISAGTGRQVFVLLEDGTLRGWGNTDWGQLGAGVKGTFQLRPVTPKITNVKAVFAVGNSTFAVKADNSLWGWGAGDRGRWPFEANIAVPTRITLP